MMDTKEAISKLQYVKSYLQREYAVKRLGLFVPFAEGTQTSNSDLDILVEFEHPVR